MIQNQPLIGCEERRGYLPLDPFDTGFDIYWSATENSCEDIYNTMHELYRIRNSIDIYTKKRFIHKTVLRGLNSFLLSENSVEDLLSCENSDVFEEDLIDLLESARDFPSWHLLINLNKRVCQAQCMKQLRLKMINPFYGYKLAQEYYVKDAICFVEPNFIYCIKSEAIDNGKCDLRYMEMARWEGYKIPIRHQNKYKHSINNLFYKIEPLLEKYEFELY